MAAASTDAGALRLRPDVPTRQHGFNLTVYDPANEKVHMLNPVATAVWYQLTPDRSLDDIADMLVIAYPKADEETVVSDLKRFVHQLREEKLLVESGEPVPRPAQKQPPQLTVSGSAMTAVEGGYQAPALKTFTTQELVHLVDKDRLSGLFCDTWTLPGPGAHA